jgi:hypothetical protein
MPRKTVNWWTTGPGLGGWLSGSVDMPVSECNAGATGARAIFGDFQTVDLPARATACKMLGSKGSSECQAARTDVQRGQRPRSISSRFRSGERHKAQRASRILR